MILESIESLAQKKAKLKMAEFYSPMCAKYTTFFIFPDIYDFIRTFDDIEDLNKCIGTVQNLPNHSSNQLINNFDFFIKVHDINIKTQITELDIQIIRDQLYSFLRPIKDLLNNMRDLQIQEDGSTISALKTGALSGAAIGNCVPILGTIAGAIMGGLSNFVYNETKLDEIKIKYGEAENALLHYLMHNINELCSVYYQFEMTTYKTKIFDILKELENNNHNAQLLIRDYLRNEIKEINALLETKVVEQYDTTWSQEIDDIYDKVNTYKDRKKPTGKV